MPGNGTGKLSYQNPIPTSQNVGLGLSREIGEGQVGAQCRACTDSTEKGLLSVHRRGVHRKSWRVLIVGFVLSLKFWGASNKAPRPYSVA